MPGCSRPWAFPLLWAKKGPRQPFSPPLGTETTHVLNLSIGPDNPSAIGTCRYCRICRSDLHPPEPAWQTQCHIKMPVKKIAAQTTISADNPIIASHSIQPARAVCEKMKHKITVPEQWLKASNGVLPANSQWGLRGASAEFPPTLGASSECRHTHHFFARQSSAMQGCIG